MRFVAIYVAQRIIIAGDNNLVSLIELIEEVRIPPDISPDTQAVALGMSVLTLFEREDYEQPAVGVGRLRLLSPQNDALFAQEFPVELEDNITRRRTKFQLPMWPFSGFGTYRFVVDKKDQDEWVEVGSYPFRTVLAPAAS